MKKQLAIVCAALGMVACMQEEVVTVQQNAISFKGAFVDNATRAAEDPSTTLEEITNFNVWGFMDQPSGYVFTGDKVEKAGDAWTYANTQYWAPNHTYYFAAVSPADSQAWSLETSGANTYGPGVLTFTNANGTEDLLYAATSVETPQYDDLQAEGMDAVKLQFNHLLSKVKFTFANGFATRNSSVEIKDIKMTAPEKGTIDLAVENWWDNDDWKVEGTKTLEFGNVALLAAGQKDECTYERLTFPVDKAYEYQVEFTVVLYTGDVVALETTKTTAISGVALEMGKAYNFTAEINPENLHLPSIEFEVEEVKDWVTAGEPSNDAQVREAELKAALLLGQTYTLPYDVEITSPVVVPAGMKATLNLNGHNIINTANSAEYGAGEGIVVYGELTINGKGTVQGCTRAVWARGNDGAKVTINGGTYKGCADGFAEGGCSVIYASSGNVIDIYGGTFEALAADEASYANTTYAALNVADNNGMINVYGGTFVKQNPAAPGTEPAAWNAAHPNGFVAEGYASYADGNNYIVVNGVVVKNADEFKAAAADANIETIVVVADLDFGTETVTIDTDKVIIGNGHNFIAGGKTTKNYGLGFQKPINVVINNLVMNGGGGIAMSNGANVEINNSTIKAKYSASGRHLFYVSNAVLTVNSGEFEVFTTKTRYIRTQNDAKVYVKGGTWSDMLSTGQEPIVSDAGTTVEITGGKFQVNYTNYKFDPTPYLATGYKAVRVGDYMEVSAE